MQGARTTRGCTGCLRRKKRCDLRKPVCGRCERLSVSCIYEVRRWHFISSHDEPHGIEPDRGHMEATREDLSLANTGQRSLVSTDMDLQIEAKFWDLYLPHEDQALDGCMGGVLAAPWIPSVRTLANINDTLRFAVNACAYCAVGWMQVENAWVQHGLRLYTRVLRETNRALQDPNSAQSDEVLACCRVLSLYEMFRRSSNSSERSGAQLSSWRNHIEGTFRLVELRGPEKHLSGHGQVLLDAVRMPAVISALAIHKPNSFTRLDWTSNQMYHKATIRDELFNMACSLPDILQEVDDFLCESSGYAERTDIRSAHLSGRELLRRCLHVCDNLKDWETYILALHRQILGNKHDHEQEACALSLEDICRQHGYGFFFLCTQYWAISIHIHASTQRMHARIDEWSDRVDVVHDLSKLPSTPDPDQCAFSIANTTSHFFTPTAGIWAAHSAVFPATTALSFFNKTGRRDSAAFRAILQAFSSSETGVIALGFLKSAIGDA